MNMFKKNGGFTLVELIVVIAILAILAGVAIPVYSGYITKAKDAAAITELDALQTAVQAANATNANGIEALTVSGTTATVTVTATAAENVKFAESFVVFYDNEAATNPVSYAGGAYTINLATNILEGSSYATNGATWTANGWVKTNG